MALILSLVNDIVLHIALVYLTFQVLDMLLHPYKSILSIYTQFEYSATLNTIISFTLKGLRTLLSVVILSPYCTEIGQLLQGALAFIIFAIIRIAKYKVHNKKLVVKSRYLHVMNNKKTLS